MELPNTANPLKSDNILIEAQKELEKAFPETKCDILYLKHDGNLALNHYNYEKVSDNVLKVTLFNKGLWKGAPDFAVNFQNSIKIFNNYILRR